MLIQRVKKCYFFTYHCISDFVACFLIKKVLKKSFHFAVVHENEDERSSGEFLRRIGGRGIKILNPFCFYKRSLPVNFYACEIRIIFSIIFNKFNIFRRLNGNWDPYIK